MISVPAFAVDEMVADAVERAPAEACGLLGGRGEVVKAVYDVENVAEDARGTFKMRRRDQVAVYFEAKRAGLEIIGTYHSHPRSNSVNLGSVDQKALAAWPDLWHLVVAPASGKIGVHRLK